MKAIMIEIELVESNLSYPSLLIQYLLLVLISVRAITGEVGCEYQLKW